MDTMIKESALTFKELEKEIFEIFCKEAREFTKEILEQYDGYLAETRDKNAYRHKGLRHTTVKTVFGEVGYDRAVYQTTDESGIRRYVYLLDETLQISGVGLISDHYAEKLVSGITTKSYRSCAAELTETTGQSISPMGVWKVIQKLGEEVTEEEKELARAHKDNRVHGKKESPVLFEETDGVNLSLQGKDRKENRSGKAEMKVAIAYDGWEEIGKKRYRLHNKVAFAGFERSGQFHRIREAKIAAEYNLDEVEVRILNGDGASWIKKVPDQETVFQLDPYHRNAAIKEKIPYPEAQAQIRKYLGSNDITGMFRYLDLYRNSLTEEEEITKATELTKYFARNAEGLLPYQKRIRMPESPEGLTYRNMGTMENHIWSIIASRMKHGHRTWSKNGANNLAKILAKKSEGRLYEITDRLKKPAFEAEKIEEIMEGLSAAKASKNDGHGYEYPMKGHIAGLDGAVRGSRRSLLAIAGF